MSNLPIRQIDQELEANRLQQQRLAAAILAANKQEQPPPRTEKPASSLSSSSNLVDAAAAATLAAAGNAGDTGNAAASILAIERQIGMERQIQAMEAANRIQSLQAQLNYAAVLQERQRQQQQQQQLQFLGGNSLPTVLSSLANPVAAVAGAGGLGAVKEAAAKTFGGALAVPPVPDARQAASSAAAPPPPPPKKRRGGVSDPFPCKFHRILSEVERDGHSDIISWLPHGRAFSIHQPEKFVSDVMPKYFRMSSISSLQRQLNLYNFKRITEGTDKGAYYHRLFLRGQPELTKDLKRTKTKKVFVHTIGADGVPVCVPRGLAAMYEPNFYAMPPVVAGQLAMAEQQQQQQQQRAELLRQQLVMQQRGASSATGWDTSLVP